MSETKNLKLKKHDNPETNTEKFDIENYLNGNWDKVDENVGKTNTEISNVKAKNTEQDSKIVILQNEKEELENELKEVKEDNYQNSIRGQASGEYIHVEDSSNCRGKIGLSGNSEQETRSGKNLFKPTLQTTTLNGITCTNNGDGTYTLNGTATDDISLDIFPKKTIPSGSYKVIGCPSGGSATTYYLIARFDGVWGNKDTGNGAIFNSTSFGKLSITIRSGVVCNNFIFKPMITSDTSLTYNDYEQYGASPSPDYPSEVESCGDNGSINEVICNKNMFNVSELNDYSYSGIALTKNEGTNKIKLNGTATKNFTIYSKDLNVNRFGIGKKYSLSKDFSNIAFNFEVFENNSDTASIWATSITMQKSYTRIRVYIQGKTNTTFNDQEIALQLEEGNATEIVPHQSQSYTIPTQQPMRAIGDIRDTFIKINGKWYERHNITRKILDGTENWMLIDNNSRFAIKITEQKAKIDVKDSNNNLTDCLSNRLINSTQLDIAKVTNGIAFSQWADTQYLYLSKIKDSIDELKKYLAENETYVDYPLEVPLDIECTSEQSAVLEKLNNARTYKNITNLYSTNEVSAILSLDYAKDLEILLNNVQALALNSSEGV